MDFTETKLKGVYIINPSYMQDKRGGFARVFCKDEFEKIGHQGEFVQINHSINTTKGTVRGMHYQEPPFSEIKLIRCIKGAIYDVIVDIRRSSPTFLNWMGIQLSETNKAMIYIPKGFAHGFQTLIDHTELMYHHTNFYTPSAERGLCYNDTGLGIQWPETVSVVSEKDKNYPPLTHHFKGIEL